jgi:hypothetical protein
MNIAAQLGRVGVVSSRAISQGRYLPGQSHRGGIFPGNLTGAVSFRAYTFGEHGGGPRF